MNWHQVFYIIVIIGFWNAYPSQKKHFPNNKRYVGIFASSGRFYIEESPTNAGMPYEIPATYGEGVEFECVLYHSNSVCTLLISEFTYPLFDSQSGCFYVNEEDVITNEDGLFVPT